MEQEHRFGKAKPADKKPCLQQQSSPNISLQIDSIESSNVCTTIFSSLLLPNRVNFPSNINCNRGVKQLWKNGNVRTHRAPNDFWFRFYSNDYASNNEIVKWPFSTQRKNKNIYRK